MKNLLLIPAFCLPMLVNAQSTGGPVKTADTTKPAPYRGHKGCPSAMTAKEFDVVKAKIDDKSDGDMLPELLAVAKKEAVAHCFLIEQVKNLMPLLRTDEIRFEFFKAVYPHIYEQDNYPKLNDSFQDKAYISKLKTYANSME